MGNLWACFLFLHLGILRTSGVVIRRPDLESDEIRGSSSVDLQTISESFIDKMGKVNYSKVISSNRGDADKWSSGSPPTETRKFKSIFNNIDCFGCNTAIWAVQGFIDELGKFNENWAKTVVTSSVYRGCRTHFNDEVCQGIVDKILVYYILKNTDMGAHDTCSFVMSDECEYVPNPLHEWKVTFPRIPKPPVAVSTPPAKGVKKLKVLQLSDIHYDPYYKEGANANCGNPLCCRSSDGRPATPADAAGKWGDYRACDTPKRTLDHLFKHIRTIHSDIDYILWTGDLPPHDIWNQTSEGNLEIQRSVMNDMRNSFPNVTIFPALGNHESAPVNSFPTSSAPSEFSISWLYNELDRQWQQRLPSGISNTVKRGAFYSVLYRPGFRIISVNTNYCNDKNFWLLINSTDPVNELQWLIDELQGAENRSEKVHIIGHIPPGSSECLKVWSANYYDIINRYESTIAAQFFGHTHFDEFEIFYDTKDLTRPVSVAYVGPSVTPYDSLNPGYRIYYVDDGPSSSRQVIDHETWTMNLEKANSKGFPTWEKLYSAQRAFQMPSLRPQDWDALLNKMVDNVNIFNLYYKHYYKDSPVRPTCNEACRKQLLCNIRSGRSRDRNVMCEKIDSVRLDEKIYTKLDIDTVESNDIDS